MPARCASTVVILTVLALSAGFPLDLGAVRVAQTPAATSSVDPAILKAYQWRSIGPARGGRSIAVSGVKGRPNEAYAGQAGGGLWKTIDGGATWKPITDGQIKSSS